MPSQTQTKTPIALPIPRRRSPLLTNPALGQDLSLSLCLHNTNTSTSTKTKNQGSRDMDVDADEYSPPAAPPPSPVNFPGESWSTALRR
ncbi:hypothetical protein LARI1_G009578 [Lachnellula arida]|uniref:Uncharacterized protein n=1 Tax=Lachnellula arida TaxID=1316785 RepID=A0A8T9B212_9HELO|nr:hypothetical protein LARI1_G009578 [Lachnellula arida]